MSYGTFNYRTARGSDAGRKTPGGPGDELPTSSDAWRMVGMITGFWVSQLVRAVADLNLAEHLADGGLSAAELAEREGSDPDGIFRLLRAAAAVGLLTRDQHHRFHSTPLLATLRRDVPGSLRGLALGRTVPGLWLIWNHFPAAVRTGRAQTETALGRGLFEHFEAHPGEGALFSAAMASATAAWAPSVAARRHMTAQSI